MRKKIGILIIFILCIFIYYLNTRNVVTYETPTQNNIVSYESVIVNNKTNISEKNREIEIKILNKEDENNEIDVSLKEIYSKYELLKNNVKNYDLTEINEKIKKLENKYNEYKDEINANEDIKNNIMSELEALKNNLDEILFELNLE